MISGFTPHGFEFPPRLVELVHFEERNCQRESRLQDQVGVPLQSRPEFACGDFIPVEC